MIELKAHRFITTDELFHEANAGALYYDKSEADNVIANKDYEIKELKKSIGKLLKMDIEQVMNEVIQNTLIYGDSFVPVEHAMRLVAELRHNKYKRCLAMAKWCYNQREIYERDSYNWELEYDAKDALRNKANIMRKWRKRWLEIAEKFKTNSTVR